MGVVTVAKGFSNGVISSAQHKKDVIPKNILRNALQRLTSQVPVVPDPAAARQLFATVSCATSAG